MATSIKRISEYLTAFGISFELYNAETQKPFSFEGEPYIQIDHDKDSYQSTTISLIEKGRGIHFETTFSFDFFEYVGVDYENENTKHILRFMLEKNSECHLGYWSLLTSHPYIAYRQSLRIEDADLTAKQILAMIRTILSSENQEMFREIRQLINPDEDINIHHEVIALREELNAIDRKLTILEMEENLKNYA